MKLPVVILLCAIIVASTSAQQPSEKIPRVDKAAKWKMISKIVADDVESRIIRYLEKRDRELNPEKDATDLQPTSPSKVHQKPMDVKFYNAVCVQKSDLTKLKLRHKKRQQKNARTLVKLLDQQCNS